MLSSLKQFFFTCKNKINNYAGICNLYRKSFRKIQTEKVLIVCIENFNHGRYGFQLINYFHKAGYSIAFYKSSSFLLNLHRYDKLIFNLSDITFFNRRMTGSDSKIDFLCFANNKNVNCPVAHNRRFELSLDYFKTKSNSTSVLRLPFFIHPVMNQYLPKKLIEKRNRILFYGSNDSLYDSNDIESRFQLMSRSEVFRSVERSDLDYISPENFEEFEKQLNNPKIKNAFFFLNSTKVWVPADKWMQVLASFDFFIATPGISMPQSHNVIEAMCTGTIPVIQYSHWFFPSLKHEQNCIHFNSEVELIRRLQNILKMEQSQIERLRNGITDYFSKYIDPNNFGVRIEAIKEKKIELLFNAEELSLNM
jgi:hypothetical protein